MISRHYLVRNVVKAAVREARATGRIAVKFPFSDYAVPGTRRFRASEPRRLLFAYLDDSKVIVRFNRTWYEVGDVKASQFRTEDGRPLRLSHGRVARARLSFRATRFVTPQRSHPAKLVLIPRFP